MGINGVEVMAVRDANDVQKEIEEYIREEQEHVKNILDDLGDDLDKVVEEAADLYREYEDVEGSETALKIVMTALYITAAQNGWGEVMDDPEPYGLVANPHA